MNRYAGFLFLITILAAISPASTRAETGQIKLLESCPGDDPQELSPLGLELAAALIPRIVGGGLNAVSAKISEAAKPEHTVATAHNGDYLHKFAIEGEGIERFAAGKGKLGLAHSCILFASLPVGTSDSWPTKELTCNNDTMRSAVFGYRDNDGDSCELLSELGKMGFSSVRPPRTVLVAELRTSLDRTAFRLEPVYLFYGASPDEEDKESNAKARKLAFSFELSRPDASDKSGRKVFATPVLEFIDIRPGVTTVKRNRQRLEQTTIISGTSPQARPSMWFSMPSPMKGIEDVVNKDAASLAAIRENEAAAVQAYSRGLFHKSATSAFAWDPILTACPNISLDVFAGTSVPPAGKSCDSAPDSVDLASLVGTLNGTAWSIRRQAEVLDGQIKAEKDQSRKDALLRRRAQCSLAATSATLVSGYADACIKIRRESATRQKLEELIARSDPMDIRLTVLEDYPKPFAKFFADMLGDDDLKKELTSAISDSLDPAKAEEERQEEEESRKTAIAAYESAVIDARRLAIEYEAIDVAKNPFDKRKKELEMTSAMLSANRQADALGLPLPFPEIGTTFQ